MNLLSLVFALVACQADVTKDKPAADVGPVTPPPAVEAAPPPTPARAPGLVVDKARSSVVAVGAKVTESHDLAFGDFSGELGLDGEAFVNVTTKVNVGSVTTDSPKLVAHLLSEDFFSAAQFPEASFASTLVTPGGENGATHTVKGTFTLRGVSREVTFPATVTITPTEVTAKAEFSINRADFGVVYPGKPDNLIQDGVVLRIQLVAPRG